MKHLLRLLGPGLLFVVAACSAAEEPENPTPNLAPTPAEEAEPTPPPEVREGFVVSTPEAEGIDAAALEKLEAKAKAEHSEALVIVKNGKLVYENYFGFANEPLVAMSASKSFVSIAYGFLLAEKKIESLDEPVVKKLPAFAGDEKTSAWKSKVTYRHLLAQTSGLDPTRSFGQEADIEAKGNADACIFEPGTSWQYSNNGVDMLAAIAKHLAGKPMDEYLNEKLFRPLGIADVEWMRDSKGVPRGAGEMFIRPVDMAKVGQTMLEAGKWKGEQIVPQGWSAESFAQSSAIEPLYGLLWWRDAPVKAVGLTGEVVAQWRGQGLADETIAKVEPLVGKKYADHKAFVAALQSRLTTTELYALQDILVKGDHVPLYRNLEVGDLRSAYAAGWLGQFLVVAPEKNLVAVRMRRSRPADYEQGKKEVDGFQSFPMDVVKIVP